MENIEYIDIKQSCDINKFFAKFFTNKPSIYKYRFYHKEYNHF